MLQINSVQQTYNSPQKTVYMSTHTSAWSCTSEISHHFVFIIVLHAYDVTLRASQQKEQELLKKLNAVQRDLQEKDRKCSKLEDDMYDIQKKMAISRDDYEQEQIELQQKSN